MKLTAKTLLESIREIVFGLEDGVVSTLGVITGIAEGTQNRFTILLAGMVVISVESLSMAVGSYLSTKSAEEAMAKSESKLKHSNLYLKAKKNALKGAVFMGISYVFGGVVPVIPYVFMTFSVYSVIISVLLSVVALGLIGVWKAKMTDTSSVKSAYEMVVFSFSAALIGFSIGKAANYFFPQLVVN